MPVRGGWYSVGKMLMKETIAFSLVWFALAGLLTVDLWKRVRRRDMSTSGIDIRQRRSPRIYLVYAICQAIVCLLLYGIGVYVLLVHGKS